MMLNERADNDNNVTPHRSEIMRIFIFKSETNPHLRAFGGDLAGSQLPKQFGPWRATGAIAPDRSPPHNLSRDVIEAAIKEQGFQLWRLSKREQSNPT
jgi:hypothetical protein